MARLRAYRWAILIAAVLLIVVLLPVAVRAEHDARWNVPEDQRPYVERALREGSRTFGRSPAEYRRMTSPSVRRLADRTCVTLGSIYRHGDATYIACYDKRTGEVVSGRTMGSSFGPKPLSDSIMELLLRI